MDATSTSGSNKTTTPGSTESGATPPYAEKATRTPGKRIRVALAAVLAAALTIPVAVHLATGPNTEPAPPTADTKAAREPVDAAEAVQQARRTGKDVIVTAQHTANSTTWAQPDGLLRTRTYSDTIRAKVGDTWKPVDTTLHRVDGGYAPKAVNDPLVFSGGSSGRPAGSRANRAAGSVHRPALQPAASTADDGQAWSELVRLSLEGHDLVVSWPGSLPTPTVEGSRALYENVRPGIDLLLTARDSGYSHVLIVHHREAAQDPLLADLNYRLSSASLKFTLDGTSNVVSARDAAGQELAAAPTPYLWDSAGVVKTTTGEATPTAAPAVAATALALPGLAGPQPGSHDAVLDASLSGDGKLGLAVNTKVLADPDTVYPVFIDPSFKGRKKNWTLLYEKAPNSSFYNGQNFNDGTNDARMGYEATTGGLSRSVFNFEHSSTLYGVTVKSATFRALQTYSWGCSARQYNIWSTTAISSVHTWNNQPTWNRVVGSQTNGHGYNATSCPDSWVAVDIKSVAQEAATKKWPQISLGLRAANESDTNAWKKFMANGESSPYIEIVYNRPPNEPTLSAMKTTPGGGCDYTSPFPSIGLSDITFSAKGTDTDGNLRYVHIKIWPTGDSAHPIRDTNYSPTSDGTATVTVPSATFLDGKTYTWTAWSVDSEGATSAWGPAGTTAYCQFLVDKTAPASPTVSSDNHYPPSGDDFSTWSKVTHGTPGLFKFSVNNNPDVVKYEYSFNAPNYAQVVDLNISPYKPGVDVEKELSPPLAGPNTLYVRVRDKAGNVSAPRTYAFFVRPRPGKDAPGDASGDNIPDIYAVDNKGDLQLYASQAGDIDSGMPASYTTENGTPEPVEGHWTGALLSHHSDWFPGDGITDMLARIDGGLYVYPGDGYGSFDIHQRIPVLLPAGAPSPASFDQIVAIGDATGDGQLDAMATTTSGDLWAFTGYTGASFEQATRLTSGAWTDRDIFVAGDISGDGVLDLVFRNNSAGELRLRQGKPAATGGTDLMSLSSAAASATPTDPVYSLAPGWQPTEITLFMGTPDASGDGIPDFWAMYKTGNVRFYRGGRTSHQASYGNVIQTGDDMWTDKVAFG
ncbi:DNRLRE domain-containing protein [Streptomyces sp. NPDC059071]|uniref:DNRLRE domain-containing protein n=1 Tax=unclassified Streptomyces TaxID=2593676 RepID=UPI003661D803